MVHFMKKYIDKDNSFYWLYKLDDEKVEQDLTNHSNDTQYQRNKFVLENFFIMKQM